MSHFERLALLLLGLLLFLPGIASRDLWNPDEPRYAEVAREMRLTGDYFVPHLNGRIYSEKPPLLFWTIALASLPEGGVSEVSARVPSLLAGIAILFLLFGIAARLFDRRVAWWSVLIFGTAGRILWQARVGQIDMLLMAFITLAMYGFVRGWTERRPGFYRLFFVAAGFATLAKGPVGLLPPLLGVLLFVRVSGERRRWRELGLGPGLLIWAAITLVWLVPAAISGGGAYLETLLLKQNVERFANPWHHFNPPWYYLTTIPADLFPWSFFLPGALWVGWRRSSGPERTGYLFALCWAAMTVLFFSLSPAKRTVYVLQMFPALAMLVAQLFAEVEQSCRSWGRSDLGSAPSRLRHWLAVPCFLLVSIFALLPLALPRAAERRPELALLGYDLLWIVGGIALLLAVCTAGAWVSATRGHARGVVTGLAVGMALAATIASWFVFPRIDVLKSLRPMSERLLAESAHDQPYAIYPRLDPPFVFYTRRFAETPANEAELQAFARGPGQRWLLIEKGALAALAAPLPMTEVERSPGGDESYVLLGGTGEDRQSAGSSSGLAQVF